MKHLPMVCLIAAVAASPVFGAGSAPMETPEETAKSERPAVTMYNQGVELMQEKRFAQAQKKFEEAVKLDPTFAEAYNNLAFTLRKQGSANYKQSLALYNRAIELKPKLAEAYMYRGILYSQMGRKADAQSDLAVLKKLSPRLAKELEEYFQTGQEEDDLYGAIKKK
jgi:tetratricopeptide (TPR) repeat protein